MKKALIEKNPPKKPRKKGWLVTIQTMKDILVLNVWEDRRLFARHAINVKTHDHATWFEKDKKWYGTKVQHALGMSVETYGEQYYYSQRYKEIVKERWILSKEDEKTIESLLPARWNSNGTLGRLSDAETDQGRKKRETAEDRRRDRVRNVMARVPMLPEDFQSFVDQKLTGRQQWMIRNSLTKDWHCSSCGGTVNEWTGWDKKVRNGDTVECPNCGEKVTAIKRKNRIDLKDRVCLIQPIDDEISVARYFRVYANFVPVEGEKKEIDWEEEIRVMLLKNPVPKKSVDIYYQQWSGFDNKGNPQNKRWGGCWLYDGGIPAALKATRFEAWSRLFPQYASAGMHMDYNGLMIASKDEKFVGMMEMLFRGRFYNLLEYESDYVSYWSWEYIGHLNKNGNTMEEVFEIGDRQKINRIREKNGGRFMLEWMRWSDQERKKVSDEELDFMKKNHIYPSELQKVKEVMSVTQIMHYLKRQMKESYPGWNGLLVLGQWEDYLRMSKDLKKDLTDEMVFRPRELKRRHDEAVAEIERRKAQIQAKEYSKKYHEAEKVLKEIRKKFEYEGKDFLITVPRKIVDIVLEGRELHHCAGATDRYFDRIKQHETYICFLRKKEAPDKAFYTIEVEPGGTIRQHRGMYDEEPEIDVVKPFLREWQREIRKRMKEEDHRLAAVSKKKREENILELKAKNNTRVLQGLAEDLMEVM